MSASRDPAAITVGQAAATLGVHRQTVRRLIAEGRLPAFRVGRPPHGHLRIPAGALDDFRRPQEAPACP